MSDYELAVLTGNGMTVAFNDELKLDRLTEEALQRMPSSQTMETLDKILADSRPAADSADFEELLGVLESMARSLRMMDRISVASSDDDPELHDAIERARRHIEEIHRYGKGHVLETIFSLTTENFKGRRELDRIVSAIVDSTSGNVSFGNLNYDTTLLGSLTSQYSEDLCDMANGMRPIEISLSGGSADAYKLRSSDRLPDGRRVRLWHLHGSVTYWRRRDDPAFGIKLKNEDLREKKMFSTYRDGGGDWLPSVVLANQIRKSNVVANQPFKYAYEQFEKALYRADKWLIIGYSFKDEVVNSLLKDAVRPDGKGQPDILIVGYGNDPDRSTVIDALGWDEDAAYRGDGVLNLVHNGAANLTAEVAWDRFVGNF